MLPPRRGGPAGAALARPPRAALGVVLLLVVALLGTLAATAGPARAADPSPSPPVSVPSEDGEAVPTTAPSGAETPDDEEEAEEEEEAASAVRGTLRFEDEPVVGAEVAVVDEAGDEVGTAETDDSGRFEVGLPGEGTYVVSLDEDTLPEGADVQGGPDREITITSNLRPRAVIYRLSSGPDAATRFDRLPQLLAEGLFTGLLIAMAAVGLSLIFGTTGLTNFAHGELVTFGGLAAYYLNTAGVPFVLAALLAVVLGGLFGAVNDVGLWRPLRRRGSGLIAMLVVSIGLAILLRAFYQLIFGGGTRLYRDYVTQTAVQIGPVRLAPKDLITMGIAVVVLIGVGLLLQRTRLGTATRAVADNGPLAAASGIDTQRVILLVWIVGAALAALAGALIGLRTGVNFQYGFQILLLIFAGVIVGGLGTAYGALLGSIVIGIVVETSTLFVPSELKTAVALGVLIVVLLVRPQGLLGAKERVG